MSTLPGLASKGEKGKSKFQSLDINNLYKVYTTEPLETQQQKNTLPRKHGMQSLGKVPTARRPPANLPSLKSEHTGSDAAVSLVPSGGAGWGKQDPNSPSTSTTPPSTSTATISNAPNASPAGAPPVAQIASAGPVATAAPLPPPSKNHLAPATPATADKSWSAVMTGSELAQPPPYQSAQFQHEFPSLSAGEGGAPRAADTQYGPGPSLRPQTEGSWMQGGSRPEPPRSSSVPLGPPPQLSGPAGPPGPGQQQQQQQPQQQQPLPQQFRGLIPQFMYRGNFASNGHGGPNFANMPGSVNGGRNRLPENRGLSRNDAEEILHRPIIREEDLNRMDDMTRDVGWASHDDIDYNQKLAFSDDEMETDKGKCFVQKEQDKTEHSTQEAHPKNWSASKTGSNAQSAGPNRGRSSEEDEVWIQRRRQQSEEVAMVIERAKQRKEEEEKRFLETKQAAAKKLQQLEEKINRSKHDKEMEESQGTINPSAVPPQPITPVPIPVPEWERDKEGRSRTPVENKPQFRESSDFRKLAQIEGKSFVRKEARSADRDSRERDREVREQSGPSFSKQFQSNLPPRFQKQQQLRNNAGPSPQPQNSLAFSEQYDVRWQQSQCYNKNTNSIRKKQDLDESESKEDDDRKDRRIDDYRGSYRSYEPISKAEDSRDYRSHDYDYKRDRNEDKWEKEKSEKRSSQQDLFDEHSTRHDRDKYDDKYQDRFERPQRPDSRDSRTSRESRHSRESTRDSEPREYHGSWADTPFEPAYDRKEHFREDRRAVPGPITKERIEAEDLKPEKKNLTQLKRGYIPEKKIDKEETQEKIEDWNASKDDDEESGTKAWADAISPNTIAPENPKFMQALEKSGKSDAKDDRQEDLDKKEKHEKEKDEKRGPNRRRESRQQWGTGAAYVYHRSSWSKKGDSRRGSRSGGPKKTKGGEWHGTDSDVSIDEVSASTESGKDERSTRMSQRSPKPSRKIEKEEKNKEMKEKDKPGSGERKYESGRRDNYVPRGEPSRHGRGGSSFRSRGGLSKRIDGYGPPPSKSPFGGQFEDKEKKATSDDAIDVSSDEKTKQNQQALSAGLINASSKDSKSKKEEERSDGGKSRSTSSHQRQKKQKEDGNDNCDTSDNSDENCKDSKSRKFSKNNSSINRSSSTSNMPRRNNPPPRFANEKRGNYSSRNESSARQNSSNSLKSYGSKKDGNKSDDNRGNEFLAPPPDKPKTKENLEDPEHGDTEQDEKSTAVCDSDGFQEVKSKKTGQRQKIEDKPKPSLKEKEKSSDRKKGNGTAVQLTPQQIANIPSLMDTPVNPPAVVPQPSTKSQFERNRQNKLPPRFAKQRENNRLQKAQLQQGICDINDVKVNHSVYGMKEGASAGRVSNAWEKPLSTHLRTEQDTILSVGIDTSKSLEQPQQATSQSNSPSIDKVMKSNHLPEKTVLDGATPPVNTIIFENTNFKSAPGSRAPRSDKSCSNKLDESGIDQSVVISSFNKPIIRDLLNKNDKQADSIQMQLAFSKEDSADMKLDFFESELSHLTDDKSSKNIGLPRSMHAITSASNTAISASTADALNFKIASVKKVWETMPTGMEHSVGQEDSNSSFSTSFGPDPNSLDPSNAFGKSADNPDDNHEGYTSSQSQPTSNNTTNVCKVKPTQQVPGTTGQTVHAATHQQHSAVVGPGIVGHPLSPPPMQPVIGAGVGLGQPPQYTANQHIGYQPSLAGNTQYGMSAIPSPPTVLFNSTQQIQAAQTGLYGAFQIDQSQVLGSQGRSQYSQYPPYNLGQTASSPYSAQSMYLQSAQPHPPPTAQAPPDLYQNLNNYRLPATGPFGQNQQLNNPTTVLISSTSNSLMSATVKPSGQQISAIGTKASGAGQAFQQQSQQGQQLYMAYDPTMQANYLPNTGVMQRGPTAPIQNNVVPTLQPSSSYYTGSTGGQTGFFQQPGSSTLPSAPLQQHQAGYGLQGNVFGTPNQTSAGLQNFSSHFLSSPIQIAAAAALNAQQYRSTNLQNSPYVKSVANHVGDSSRPQQIKSPGSQQDVLSSVFNSGPQIPSPKSRQNMKQPPPQPSPTAQHKYNLYQAVGNQSVSQAQRYPTPIQRPVTFQPAVGAIQNNSSNSQKHRATNQGSKLSGRNYYGSQGSTNQNEKGDDVKLGDNITPISSNSAIVTSSIASKTVISSSSTTAVNQTAEIAGDATKDETSAIKD